MAFGGEGVPVASSVEFAFHLGGVDTLTLLALVASMGFIPPTCRIGALFIVLARCFLQQGAATLLAVRLRDALPAPVAGVIGVVEALEPDVVVAAITRSLSSTNAADTFVIGF